MIEISISFGMATITWALFCISLELRNIRKEIRRIQFDISVSHGNDDTYE